MKGRKGGVGDFGNGLFAKRRGETAMERERTRELAKREESESRGEGDEGDAHAHAFFTEKSSSVGMPSGRFASTTAFCIADYFAVSAKV